MKKLIGGVAFLLAMQLNAQTQVWNPDNGNGCFI